MLQVVLFVLNVESHVTETLFRLTPEEMVLNQLLQHVKKPRSLSQSLGELQAHDNVAHSITHLGKF